MIDWWYSLKILEQVMACIAIPATVILIVQTILILFTSFGGDGDIDSGDIDDLDLEISDGLEIFTIKGFVSFFSIFGWSGLLFLRMGLNEVLALVIAFAMGIIAMLLIALAFSAMSKLQDSGNVEIQTALGVSGIVYIKIPKKRSGMGKISAIVSGRYSEFDAITDEENDIATGASIVVVAISSPNVLVVARK